MGIYISSNIHCYYTLKEKGVIPTSIGLQTSNRESFAKMSRLDVCKPIRLHNSFLLKYNRGPNNKYLLTLFTNHTGRPTSRRRPRYSTTFPVMCIKQSPYWPSGLASQRYVPRPLAPLKPLTLAVRQSHWPYVLHFSIWWWLSSLSLTTVTWQLLLEACEYT